MIEERCGLLPSDKPARLPEGSLGPLTAQTICSGPFKIVLTESPREHLSLVEVGETMVLRILSLKAILTIFSLQHCGLFKFVFHFFLLKIAMPACQLYSSNV